MTMLENGYALFSSFFSGENWKEAKKNLQKAQGLNFSAKDDLFFGKGEQPERGTRFLKFLCR